MNHQNYPPDKKFEEISSFDEQKKEARKRVESFDKIDGFKDRDLKTILFALQAGLKNPETGAQFDALVMLEDFLLMIAEEMK